MGDTPAEWHSEFDDRTGAPSNESWTSFVNSPETQASLSAPQLPRNPSSSSIKDDARAPTPDLDMKVRQCPLILPRCHHTVPSGVRAMAYPPLDQVNCVFYRPSSNN
jgi:hypothetical protein